MSPESIAFLDANRHHWDLWQRAQYVQHLDGATKQTMLDVVHKEFNAGYITDLWCSVCVVELLRYCYTQYDKWLAEQKERIVPMTFPKHDGN